MKNYLICLIIIAAAGMAGCGYHLASGGYIHDNVTRVSVAVFENKSAEARAGIAVTNELIHQITERSDTIVVDADATTRKITGTVQSITFSTLSRSSTENVTERQVQVVMNVALVGGEDKILWSVKNFSATESYSVSDSSVNDEANKRQAIDLIAERAAERLVSQMMSNF